MRRRPLIRRQPVDRSLDSMFRARLPKSRRRHHRMRAYVKTGPSSRRRSTSDVKYQRRSRVTAQMTTIATIAAGMSMPIVNLPCYAIRRRVFLRPHRTMQLHRTAKRLSSPAVPLFGRGRRLVPGLAGCASDSKPVANRAAGWESRAGWRAPPRPDPTPRMSLESAPRIFRRRIANWRRPRKS